MTYYFGSSHGSRAKDEVLGRAVTGQVIRSLWDGMVKEARLVPYTVALVSFLSLVVAAFVWPGVITPPASKASIVDLVHRFDRFELSISVDATKNRILLMDAEIYQLEREVARARHWKRAARRGRTTAASAEVREVRRRSRAQRLAGPPGTRGRFPVRRAVAHDGPETVMMQREPRRWRTSFGRWVRAYGAARIASGMQRTGHPVTHWAVYHWMAGSHSPRAEHIAPS